MRAREDCLEFMNFPWRMKSNHSRVFIVIQMYGRYTKELGEYAKIEARKLKILERRRKKEDKARDKVSHGWRLFVSVVKCKWCNVKIFRSIIGTFW